eukprot:COSAG01_NODE_370_length_18018_cov_142.063620_22_plen_173_part_00
MPRLITRRRRLPACLRPQLVLAAAMWSKPHFVALDEPTNYLDNDTCALLIFLSVANVPVMLMMSAAIAQTCCACASVAVLQARRCEQPLPASRTTTWIICRSTADAKPGSYDCQHPARGCLKKRAAVLAGVIVISHNVAFVNALCNEWWTISPSGLTQHESPPDALTIQSQE